MRFATLRVYNYKSFADSGEMHIQPGFNVVVGRNNVGKTALTEAISLGFEDKPHRSLQTVRTPNAQPDPTSRVEVVFGVDADELREVFSDELPNFSVPLIRDSELNTEGWFNDAVSDGARIKAVYGSQGLLSVQLLGFPEQSSENRYIRFRVDPSTGWFRREQGIHADSTAASQDLRRHLADKFRDRVYGFRAVRFGIDEHPISPVGELATNASNLVQVLHMLTANPNRWGRFVASVRTVLPEIKAITFVPSDRGGGAVRALLWNVDPNTERQDLAVSLSESGTGVGQVLAILYVAFTSEYSRTIVIDEPQSFLHPGAVRKLFEILKSYPQHQYVITTHSPNAVTAADPNALFLVHKDAEHSVVEQIDAATVRQQGRFLREVGATLSDVFGADNVLWVEGATEEECFPIIITKLLGHQLLGTKVVGVVHTSDFERKHARTALTIYTGLSEVKGILPPTLGFVFDRETRSDKEREELEARSGGRATLMNRRMYENYLLNPRAIAYVASRTEGFREGEDVSPEEVEEWIEEHRWEADYFDVQVEESTRTERLWLTEVDGAKVLEDLFTDLSETRVTYDKVTDGAKLTRWLCENAPEDLEELASLIKDRLDKRERSPGEATEA